MSMVKVLIIDDNPSTVMPVAEALRILDYQVLVCNSVDAAHPFLRSGFVDIFIIDKSMPGGDLFPDNRDEMKTGRLVYDEIRNVYCFSCIPVIILTNYKDGYNADYSELTEKDILVRIIDKEAKINEIVSQIKVLLIASNKVRNNIDTMIIKLFSENMENGKVNWRCEVHSHKVSV
ncbi:response regulator [Armatimonas rosea]|uniref:CheY-like chemotaxis protein n=1 Tax=Armatimonas rosea TaxID=685828 RepID=A0A7W9SLJ4_ARMRO|nr:response regulator [Armatimonas rosea]MBB6048861.1 CheY-like chemotaxis protein [Armatimonas rosea]